MKTAGLLFFWIIVILSPVFSQKAVDKVDKDRISKAELKLFLEYLASDNLGGRAAGTTGYDKAAGYADSLFGSFGLEKIIDSNSSFYQEFTLEKYTIDSLSFITCRSNKAIDTFYVSKNFLPFRYGAFKDEVVDGSVLFVDDGIYEPHYGINDFRGHDIMGKWLLMNQNVSPDNLNKLPKDLQAEYMDMLTSALRRAEYAEKKGAVGILLVSSMDIIASWELIEDVFQNQYTIQNFSPPFASRIPVLFTDFSLFSVLRDDKSGPVNLSFQKQISNSDPVKTRNVVGVVRGTDADLKEEYLVVGAHLDHDGIKNGVVYNGADDNASGSASVLELAKVIAENPLKHSLVFVLFSAEELVLLGSHYYVNHSGVNPKQVKAMINLDMIGRSDAIKNGIIPITVNDGFWKKHTRRIDHESSLRWDVGDTFPRKNSSDHYPFYANDIPAIHLFSGFHADYHQPTDDSEKIDFDFLKANTELVYEMLSNLDED